MKSKIFIVFFAIIFTQMGFSQVEGNNDDFKQYSSSLFDSEQNSLFVVSNMTDKLNPVQLNQNNVNIQQIGDFNVINAAVNSDNSKLFMSQNGFNNSIDLIKNTAELYQKITQTGDNNTISDLTYYSNYKVNMEMNQNGNNQTIQNIGTNSLSKDMKISQTGNGTSIIIINQ
ncbi:hypothetical protein [uncultured Flavobacterium sp.]|uniref:hypothetical protein n=1 Tax=uncultured Flavobacterium sp. TaxID=165435 RepID=UPI0030ED84BA|tara:strand:- start:13060 stop:13575 length:516 start_codon:yes stop_codon:yes gene_type:complete